MDRSKSAACLVDPGEDLAGDDGLAFLREQALDCAGFGGADFVLHFHSFHDEQALACGDLVAEFDEQANDFSRHGSGDLLAAFDFVVAVSAAAPGAWIDELGGEFVMAGLQRQGAVGLGSDADFVGFAIEQDGENVRGDFYGVSIDGFAIDRDVPAVGVAMEFDGAGFAGDLDFQFH